MNNVLERTTKELIENPIIKKRLGRLKAYPLPINALELSEAEIRGYLGGDKAYTDIVRSLILLEVYKLRSGTERVERTARAVWYDSVKPVISKLGILYNLTSDGNKVDWPKTTQEVLTDLVKVRGVTTYEELEIVDTSRNRFAAREVPARLVNVNMVGGHYPWLILFTEKDTVWGVIESLATLYGVSAMSGQGQPSNAASENLIREIVRSDAFKEAQPDAITLLTFTDYDPAGYSISNAPYEQMESALNNMDNKPAYLGINKKRLGLVPSQLTEQQIAAKAYQPAGKMLDDWFNKTGGINGQPLGLELDSLNYQEMRLIFAREIEKQIDMTRRYNDLKEAFIDLMACYQLLPEFNKRRKALIDQAKASGVWDQVQRASIPKDLFIEAAKLGDYWISPKQTLELFSDFQDRLIDLWDGD